MGGSSKIIWRGKNVSQNNLTNHFNFWLLFTKKTLLVFSSMKYEFKTEMGTKIYFSLLRLQVHNMRSKLQENTIQFELTVAI